jgi:cell division ATPase FtsA
VLTGGNTLIRGADELAAVVFGMPVKIGYPSGMTYTGLATEVESPVYSTAVGLAIYGLDEDADEIETIDHSFVENKNSTIGQKQDNESKELMDKNIKVNENKEEKKKSDKSVFKKIKNFFEEL